MVRVSNDEHDYEMTCPSCGRKPKFKRYDPEPVILSPEEYAKLDRNLTCPICNRNITNREIK